MKRIISSLGRRCAGLLALATASLMLCTALCGCPVLKPEVENLQALMPIGEPPVEGQFVDVWGNKMFYMKAGTAKPNVVFVAGLDENVRIWRKVFDEIAEFATVVAYDRAGVGWSAPGRNPRTASTIAQEMDAFLQEINLEPPYYLCAHSLGGLYARYYAAVYPNKVKGLLLLDTSHEDMWRRQALQLGPHQVAMAELMMGVTQAGEGILQVGALGEYYNLENTTNEVRNERKIPWVPLLLLSQDLGNFERLEKDPSVPVAEVLFREFYWEQASLSPRGEWREVKNTSHFIMVDQPQEVIDGMKWVIDQAAGQ